MYEGYWKDDSRHGKGKYFILRGICMRENGRMMRFKGEGE